MIRRCVSAHAFQFVSLDIASEFIVQLLFNGTIKYNFIRIVSFLLTFGIRQGCVISNCLTNC